MPGGSRRLPRLALLAATALVAVACGGEDEPDPPASAMPAPSPLFASSTPGGRAAPELARTSARRPRQIRDTGLLSTADEASFRRLRARLGGEIGLAVGPLGRSGPRERLGVLTTGSAWSTIKVPIAAKAIEDGTASATDSRVRRALTASDNAAVADLWRELSRTYGGARGAAAAVGEVIDSAGDGVTRVSTRGRGAFSPYGQTEWSLAGQQKFISGLAAGCSSDPAAATAVLELMGEVVDGQRWGLGAAGVPARFKGGWGPGVDGRYLVRQFGVLEFDGGDAPVGVAVAARSGDGSFEGGQRLLTSVSKWAAEHVDADRAPEPTC